MSINQTLLELSPKWPTYRQTMTELSAGPNPICTSDTDFGGTFYQTFLSTLVDDFKDFGVIDEKDFSIKEARIRVWARIWIQSGSRSGSESGPGSASGRVAV